MAFNGYEFIFDGVPGMKYDLILYDIGSNKQGDTISFPSAGKLIEDRTSRRPTSLLYGTEKNQPLSFPLVFGASPSRMERNAPFDRFEIEAISSWLTGHSTWKWLKIEQPDFEGVRYRCLITELQQISYGNYPWAFSCTVTCDSPYAYRAVRPQEFNCILSYPQTITFPWLLEAMCLYGIDGDTSRLDSLTYKGVNGLGFRKNISGDWFSSSDMTGVCDLFRDLPIDIFSGWDTIFYDEDYTTLTMTWREVQYYLLNRDFELDARIPPYSWEVNSKALRTTDSVDIVFRNRSSHNELYYPVLEITLEETTAVSIVNRSIKNSCLEFKDIPASVKKITIDNDKQTIIADNGLNLYPCCNFGFLGLVRGDNKLSVFGNCVLRFICDFPVNVGG